MRNAAEVSNAAKKARELLIEVRSHIILCMYIYEYVYIYVYIHT